MTNVNGLERARQEGMLLGIPLGELGWFQTLLMSFATGFAAFFATTFVAIVSLLVYMSATGKHPDFALTYKCAGFPVGVVVLALTLGYLGTLWARRKIRKG
jgi:ABC-type dipeptide/oligopeptide/nickel transport system permease subunit